jgi:hypothetical protein
MSFCSLARFLKGENKMKIQLVLLFSIFAIAIALPTIKDDASPQKGSEHEANIAVAIAEEEIVVDAEIVVEGAEVPPKTPSEPFSNALGPVPAKVCPTQSIATPARTGTTSTTTDSYCCCYGGHGYNPYLMHYYGHSSTDETSGCCSCDCFDGCGDGCCCLPSCEECGDCSGCVEGIVNAGECIVSVGGACVSGIVSAGECIGPVIGEVCCCLLEVAIALGDA